MITEMGPRVSWVRGEVCKMGQLTCSMGPEWMKIFTCAPMATTPSKAVYIMKTHSLFTVYLVQYFMYILLLCRLKINYVKEI
jgi:hypothetical protein